MIQRNTLMLRLSYWLTAVADFGIAILVLMPQRMGVAESVYPMGLMSSVAFSWGVMLVIADRRPFQRRWVLVPTILVIGLLSLTRIIFSLRGAVEFSPAFLVVGVLLMILLGYSYYSAERAQG